jgi:two-component system OmpR family response regulator
MSTVEIVATSPSASAPAGATEAVPCWIDDCGLLHVGDRWVALPDTEWRLLAALLDRFGMPVRREALIDAIWAGGAVRDGALNVSVGRTRRRIEPLGLRIANVRGRGYVLESA